MWLRAARRARRNLLTLSAAATAQPICGVVCVCTYTATVPRFLRSSSCGIIYAF